MATGAKKERRVSGGQPRTILRGGPDPEPEVSAGAAANLPELSTLPPAQLPPGMPPEMFTAPGMLAVADLLPIMCAYVDREEKVRFLNKPLAEYLERPREELLGRSVREMMGDDIYRDRKPLLDAAMAGEKQFFVAENEHPTRGSAAIQAEYVPWTQLDGKVS
jgi:PAS domain-containing protein